MLRHLRMVAGRNKALWSFTLQLYLADSRWNVRRKIGVGTSRRSGFLGATGRSKGEMVVLSAYTLSV